MSSAKLQYVSIAILGAACIGLIIWFLLSDSSPVLDKASGNVYALVTESDVEVEIRKNETSYWAGFNLTDTLNVGDVIRSTESGLVYLDVSGLGYIELVAPFELKLNQTNSRNPLEWMLTNGRMRYFYSFDSIDVPNTIATAEGKFVFSPVSNSEVNYREIIVSNSENDIQLRVLSGNGSWVETNQSALVSESEILRRSKSNNELFKSTLSEAPANVQLIREGNSLVIDWQALESEQLIVTRVLQAFSDTLKHVSTTSGITPTIIVGLNGQGTYLIQISEETPGSGASIWTSPYVQQID